MNPDEVKIQSELLVEKWVCFLAWVFDIVMNDTYKNINQVDHLSFKGNQLALNI